ncbi:Fis family transcriptional regulator [Actinocrispum wychmicini]|uniref:Fis family transcriptional regulator n=1 Tax=Actinocrispum wychmicini TaxID=1213861 RepID=A0A4R2J8J1_9PSEU|nr:Fis family transcriptional regulator [Actinocrispum wychmicini]TCO55583.1 hypothetical protein EV192_1074 [Actinocrispum wychmicini]
MTKQQRPTTQQDRHPAHFDTLCETIIIEHMTIRDAEVIREAHRWSTGQRGPLIDDPNQLAGSDLTNYITEALRIGAHALSVTGQAHEARAFEHMLNDLGDRTADSARHAAQTAGRAATDAANAVIRATNDAKKAIMEADAQSRREFTTAVTRARRELSAVVRTIFGGENPELLERLQPVLDKFGTHVHHQFIASTHELLTKAAKQFDPTDPTSPMAKHTAELRVRQEKLAAQLTKNHIEIATKVDDLSTRLKVHEAKTLVAKITPIKGGSYAEQIHVLMRGIAAGLGAEYADTSAITGHLPRCKKGDGVLTVDSGTVRVVIEATDSARTGWSDYLDEAERNRDASCSLGLVRTLAQNGDQTIRGIGLGRIVMAFDPDNDDPEFLRTTIVLLRAVALIAAAPKGSHQIAVAEENIQEALGHLREIDSVKKLAGVIHKNAEKIDSGCVNLNSSIRRLLDQALAALAGAEPINATTSSVNGSHKGIKQRKEGRPMTVPRPR